VVEDIPWSRGKSPHTEPLIYILSTFAGLLPWDQVANMFNVSWGTVNSAVKAVVEYGLEHRDLSNVRIIGIDEISRKKRHVYHTNVYDLEAKTLIWSGEGRKAETLEKFFDEMPDGFEENLVGVCCDMWGAYESVVLKRAPQAILVFDKFHLVKHLHDAVDKVRKEEIREFEDSDFNPLTGTKYIWLKNPWNLTPKQKQSLGYLETINLKITRAYLLKESFREFWSYNVAGWAEKYLDKWFWWATHSRIKQMRDFAWLVRRHEEHILSWFKLPIDNGAVEAMNNNAKVISHRARGFRTDKVYTRAMLHVMGGLPRPEIVHKFL
jgi:transposase